MKVLRRLHRELMMEKCYEFMVGLRDALGEAYTFGKSPFAPTSCYLVPKGTEDQNTWYSKPLKSFRCSDHWNWYANLKKNSDPKYLQCRNVDAFWPQKRVDEYATKPVWNCCVGYFDEDYQYHVVYGQKYNRKTRELTWVESDPKEVLKNLALI